MWFSILKESKAKLFKRYCIVSSCMEDLPLRRRPIRRILVLSCSLVASPGKDMMSVFFNKISQKEEKCWDENIYFGLFHGGSIRCSLIVAIQHQTSKQTLWAQSQPVLRILISMFLGLLVTDPGPRYGSGSESWSFYHQAKIARKNLDSYCFVTSLWLFIILSFKNNANVASKGKRQKIRKQFLDAVLKVTDEK